MELGNVYEVFQLEDRVKIIEPRLVYYGKTGTIVQIEDISYNTEPIYTVRLDEIHTPFFDPVRSHEIKVNAKGLEKIPHKRREKTVITSGQRNGKAMRTLLEKMVDESSQFDAALYSFDFLNKLTGGTDEMNKLDVKKIIFNGPKTIVLWTDGTKTIVSMSKDEPRFDPEAAFCAAYTKKMFDSNSKIKRVIKEKSNIEKWKELNEVPEDQLYKLGLKALGLCEDIDMEAIERVAKEAKKLQDEIVQAMYNTLTGHPYKEDNDGNN